MTACILKGLPSTFQRFQSGKMEDIKPRDSFFDNAKFFLITLVVMGHFLEPFVAQSFFLKAIYVFIYFFHMPLFVFISGYFSKNVVARQKELFTRLLFPFIVFQILYNVFYMLLGKKVSFGFFHYHWILWYFISLYCWRLVLPSFSKLKRPILISFLLAILIGYEKHVGTYMSLSRTFTFFPFFLLGYYAEKRHFDRIRANVNKRTSSIILLTAFLAVSFTLLYFPFDLRWLYGRYSYSYLNAPELYAGMYRLGIYVINGFLGIIFLCLIPAKKNALSGLGYGTIYVYLLHGFPALYLSAGLIRFPPSFLFDVLLIVSAVLTSIVLSTRATRRLARPLVEPELRWLFVPPSKE